MYQINVCIKGSAEAFDHFSAEKPGRRFFVDQQFLQDLRGTLTKIDLDFVQNHRGNDMPDGDDLQDLSLILEWR